MSTKTLNFHSSDLGRDSNLILTFDSEIRGIYKDVFPIAFKVVTFGAKGTFLFTTIFKPEFGFTRALIDKGIVVPASTYTHIHPGGVTTLMKSGLPARYTFSPPSGGMEAKNGTDASENIGIGFFDNPDKGPTQVLVATDVRAGSIVQPEFTLILRGYIALGYQENELLKTPIPTTKSPILFNEDLTSLKPVTDWMITYNPASGEYAIEEFNV